MEIKAVVKNWGNSFGIILPKEMARIINLKPKEEIIVSIKKKPDVMKLFGAAKLKRTAQAMKDEGREGWQ